MLVPYHFFMVSFSALLISHFAPSLAVSHTIVLVLIAHGGTDYLGNL